MFKLIEIDDKFFHPLKSDSTPGIMNKLCLIWFLVRPKPDMTQYNEGWALFESYGVVLKTNDNSIRRIQNV